MDASHLDLVGTVCRVCWCGVFSRQGSNQTQSQHIHQPFPLADGADRVGVLDEVGAQGVVGELAPVLDLAVWVPPAC